jgi:hypothetical protein
MRTHELEANPTSKSRVANEASDFLNKANDPLEKVPKAMIAPHARYSYRVVGYGAFAFLE